MKLQCQQREDLAASFHARTVVILVTQTGEWWGGESFLHQNFVRLYYLWDIAVEPSGSDLRFCLYVSTLSEYQHQWWLSQNDFHCACFSRPNKQIDGTVAAAAAAGSSVTSAVHIADAAAWGILGGGCRCLYFFSITWFFNHKYVHFKHLSPSFFFSEHLNGQCE